MIKNMFKPIHNQNGISVVLILVIAALFAVTGYCYAWYQAQIYRQLQQTEIAISISNVRSNIVNILNQDSAWTQTVLLNVQNNNKGGLACLTQNGVTCTPTPSATGGNLDIYGPNGVAGQPFATSSGTQGFDRSGNVCTTFGDLSTVDDCIFQFQVNWSCNGGACAPTVLLPGQTVSTMTPQIAFTIHLNYVPKQPNPVPVSYLRWDYGTPGSFSPILVRGVNIDTLASLCEALGASFNASTQLCSFVTNAANTSSDLCPAGQSLVSYSTSGQANCQLNAIIAAQKGSAVCTTGVIGYNSDGSLVCAGTSSPNNLTGVGNGNQ